ncbi:MAG: PPC domain-containing protein [Planctomycetaceae bacterium]
MVKNIEAVRPRIGQRGTVVDVSLHGISLQGARQVIFFRPGIRAINLQASSPLPRRGFAHGGTIVEEVRCQFEIAGDCPPGEYAFRLLTSTELTCIGTFHVSPFPVIDENEPNNAYANETREQAMVLTGNVTVRGQLGNGAREDLDVYRIDAEAGQRISVEVQSAGIADQHYGDSEFDLAVRITDSAGRVLASGDDNPLRIQDPVASVKAVEDGPIYVEVRRSIFAQSETLYCVHIGDFQRPLAAFPPGGPVGEQVSITFIGDPTGSINRTVTLPSESPVDADTRPHLPHEYAPTSFWIDDFGDAPTPLRLRCSHFPNVLEDSSAAWTNVPELPAAANGIIDSRSDTDAWKLTVTRGQKLHVRTFAASLGSPIDAAIRLRPLRNDGTAGEVELELDDSPLPDHDIFGTSFRGGGGLQEAIDPSMIWEPKEDGEYLLEIVDGSGAGGPTGVYRIEICEPQTIVQTLLPSQTFDWTESTRVTGLAIPQGNRWTIDISFPDGQWNRLNEDFDLIARGLPRGVQLLTPRIPAGTARWPVQFTAEADAEAVGAVIILEARPVSGRAVETRCQQNVPFINHSGGSAWRTVRTDRYILGVTDAAPFTLHVDQPQVALVRGGELAIPVRIERHGDFSEPVEIRCGGLPGAISNPPPEIISGDVGEGILQLGASSNAALGKVPLYVIGSTVREDIDSFLGTGHIRVSSELVSLEVAQPFVELTAEPDSIRRGETKPFTWNVHQKSPFAGTADVTLLGLPKGVQVVEPLPALTSNSTQIVFQLHASDEALLGQVTGLTCEVSIPVSGQQILQRTGKASLRIDPRQGR